MFLLGFVFCWVIYLCVEVCQVGHQPVAEGAHHEVAMKGVVHHVHVAAGVEVSGKDVVGFNEGFVVVNAQAFVFEEGELFASVDRVVKNKQQVNQVLFGSDLLCVHFGPELFGVLCAFWTR